MPDFVSSFRKANTSIYVSLSMFDVLCIKSVSSSLFVYFYSALKENCNEYLLAKSKAY